jgi:hypothetical protein
MPLDPQVAQIIDLIKKAGNPEYWHKSARTPAPHR